MWIYLLQGIMFGFAAAVTPGPLAIFVITQAAAVGWKRAMPAAFSPLISDGPIAIFVLAVLNQMPPAMIFYLRLLGGAFLLYLAYGALKAFRSFVQEKSMELGSGSGSALKAAIINWLNPNPYIAWSVILGPIFISGWRASPSNGIALLAGFYIVMIASMMAMILLFASAQKLGRRSHKALIAISSVALAGFGVYQIWMGISPFI
jgi:threonine/homoserine/homoserine lactone efflux protein